MPKTLALVSPGVEQITHDPTKTINGDPMSILGDNPFGVMTEEIIFGAANTLLSIIDDVTGFDLLPAAQMLESILPGGAGGAGFPNFLTYLSHQPATNDLGLPTPGVAAGGMFTSLLSWLTPGLDIVGGGVFGGLIGDLGLNTLGEFTAVFGGLNLLIDNPIVTLVEQQTGTVVDTIANALSDLSEVGHELTNLSSLLAAPMELMFNLQDGVGYLFQELAATAARLEGRIIVVENNKADKTTTLGSVYDDCSSVTGFTTITGMNPLVSNGSSIRSPGLGGGYHNVGPNTDSHGIRFALSRKTAGTLHVGITSDIAATNWFGLRIRTDGFGNDYVRAVTGDSPTNTVTHGQWNGRLSEKWVWETYYDLATNTYHTLVNGVEVDDLLFEDVDGLVSHGTTKRKPIVISNVGNSSVFPGFAVTEMTIYDRVP